MATQAAIGVRFGCPSNEPQVEAPFWCIHLFGILRSTPVPVSRRSWPACHREIDMRVGEAPVSGGACDHGAVMGWSPHTDTIMQL